MAAVVGMTEGSAAGGYKVPIIVPKFVIKASPGPAYSLTWKRPGRNLYSIPETKKKPAASHHIV